MFDRSSRDGFNFDKNPFLVVWEVTRACQLACRHCRADAQRQRDPRELDEAESEALLDQIARAGPAILILSGGDPVMRPDIEKLIEGAARRGLRVALSPSATEQFLQADLRKMKQLGLGRISFSLDGATARSHDRFRGVRGTWERTMRALAAAAEADLPVQINTTITRRNLPELDEFAALLGELRPSVWSVFQLVPTGRAKPREMLSGEEMEALFIRLHDLSQRVPFLIKTTEGQHYRRVVLQHSPGANGARRSLPGINDGKGFVFVSHIGEICPSGFLPLVAGNVRERELIDVYRESPLFRQLRDPSQLKGKCGRCEYNRLCGGSRARAFATTGDFLAEEPLCIYQPRNPAPPTIP